MADVNIDINLAVKKALSDLKKTEKQTKKTSEGFSTLGKSVIVVNQAFALGQKVLGALSGAFSTVTDAAQVQEDAINELDFALRSAGETSDRASNDFQAFASSLQKVTTFGDEATISAGALFVQLTKVTGDGLKNGIIAAQNLSAALGIDLKTSVRLLAKSVEDGGSGLKRYNVSVEKGKTSAETLANATAAVNEQFSGVARSKIETYSGATTQASNAYGDLLEEIGFFITKNPAVIEAINSTTKAFEGLGSFVKGIRDKFSPLQEAEDKVESLDRRIEQLNKEVQVSKDETNFLTKALSFFVPAADANIERIKKLTEERKIAREEVKKLKNAEVEATTTSSEESEKQVNIIELRNAAIREKNQEDIELNKEMQLIRKDEELTALAEELGEKEVLKALHDARLLEQEGKTAAAKKKLTDLEAKREKQSIQSLFDFEKNTNAGRAANLKSTLNTIATLSSSGNKTLAVIGKSAAIGTATIDGIIAVQKALALGPILGPPAAIVTGIATAANVAKIGGVKGFQDGGLVGGSSFTGDRVPALVNSGELILNRAQQDTVAPQLAGGNITVNVQAGVVSDNDSLIDQIVEGINRGTEFRNLQLQGVA
jgi:hypothetical protein